MKVEIIIDKKITEDKVCIYTKENKLEIEKLYQNILNDYSKLEVYSLDDKILINLSEIDSIYAESGKVYVKTKDNQFILKRRLYDIEAKLPQYFIRISKSEIVNFYNVTKLDSNIIGTLKICFKSGNISYSSRRYIKKIKDLLEKGVI